MKVKANPNRMELLRFKRRRSLAQRGHRLLQDKLEKLVSEFHKLVKKFKQLSCEWERVFGEFLEDYIILKIEVGEEKLLCLINTVALLEMEIGTERLLNLKLPIFSFKNIYKESYSPKLFPPQWDRLWEKREQVMKVLLEISTLYFAIKMVGEEILKTRRRVNALEYVLIPNIDGSIRFIADKLTELEREFLSRLLRIKDLIRK
jgi:V/A-type H+-transporting ATPase subunit D